MRRLTNKKKKRRRGRRRQHPRPQIYHEEYYSNTHTRGNSSHREQFCNRCASSNTRNDSDQNFCASCRLRHMLPTDGTSHGSDSSQHRRVCSTLLTSLHGRMRQRTPHTLLWHQMLEEGGCAFRSTAVPRSAAVPKFAFYCIARVRIFLSSANVRTHPCAPAFNQKG